jgi:hypothetical protein
MAHYAPEAQGLSLFPADSPAVGVLRWPEVGKPDEFAGF